MERRGNMRVGLLICLIVLAAAGAILFFVNRQILGDSRQRADMAKMRSIFTATFLYSSVNDEQLPPNLGATRRLVGDKDIETFQSSGDPFTTGTDFPADPAFPSSPDRSPIRISFTYLPEWIQNKKLPASSLKKVGDGPPTGLIVCYWYGNISTDPPDGLNTRGEIIRLNIDGSFSKIDESGRTEALDGKALFLPKVK